jgi:ribonuclease HI
LEDSLYTELAEISPLFERQTQSNDEMWMKLKGISHATPNDMLRLSNDQMLLPDLLIMDSTSKASRVLLDESHMELLSKRIAIFTYLLLMPFRMAKDASIETPNNWGIFAKHSIKASTVFVDGSCSNQKIMPILAGFGVFIPHKLNDYVSTSISYCGRIPGMQTNERSEAFAVLAALLLSTDTGPITIYSDCQKLVNTVNRYKLIPPKPHEVINLHDRSFILRILNEIQFRRFPTSLEFLRNHVQLEKPLKDGRDVNDERLRSCIEYGKQADKKAKESLSLTNIFVPDETKFRSEIGLFIHSPIDDATTQTLLPNVVENNTTELYNGIIKRTQQHYLRKGSWHQYMLASSERQETSFSILHTKRGLASLKLFLIHILARTLPTYHWLNLVRAKLFTNTSCSLCGAVDESIEHIFYECPHFVTERLGIQQQAVNLCLNNIRESQRCNASNIAYAADSVSEATIRSLIFPTLSETEQYRTFSAGQLSKAFQTWLLSIAKCPNAANKIGCAIHIHLVSSYQNIWKLRCSMNKMSGLDFKYRLACSPRGVPLHELFENDYVIYANHETIARARSKN